MMIAFSKNVIRASAFATLAVACMAAAPVAAAADVNVRLSSREAYVGMPVTVYLEIANASTHDEPELPSIADANVKSAGVPSRSSQTTIINGRRTDRTSMTYAWKITPRRAGEFKVPSFNVKVDGQVRSTAPVRFVATKSVTGDLLYAEVEGQQDKIYVGQALPLTLRIWLKPYHDRDYDITLSEGDMWQMVSDEQSNWGVFAEAVNELAQNRQRLRGQEVLRRDDSGIERSYFLYQVQTTVYPKRPGQVDAGDVQIVARYPTKLARSRDLFSRGSLEIAGVRPLVAGATVAPIEVQPIPTEGQPADYRGAVGHYDIVTQAVPTKVSAGDPITLHIGITGDGPMELVQAPPLAELSELVRGFKVPNEAIAGIVQDDAKLFTVSIRPKHAGITEIPGIPLTYFDPTLEKYVTARSEPIAIDVSKADSLSLGSVVGSGRIGGSTAPDGEDAWISKVSFENYTDEDALSSERGGLWSWPLVLRIVAPPMLFLGLIAVRNRERLAGVVSSSKVVASRRAKNALNALNAARTPEDVSSALLGYVAFILDAPASSLTRGEAIRRLTDCANVNGLNELDGLLAECEQSRFAGGGDHQMQSLVTKAKTCLALLNGANRRS